MLNDKLIYYRHQNNLSQNELAKKMYVSRQTISNWENGKTYPDIRNLVLISEIYQISIDQLVKNDINLLQNTKFKYQLKFLSISLILSLILVYGSFISIRWLPIVIAAMMVSVFSTLGMITAVKLIKLNNKLHLRTLKQTLDFLNGKSVEQIQADSKRQKIKLTVATLVGIILGTILTYLIATTILN